MSNKNYINYGHFLLTEDNHTEISHTILFNSQNGQSLFLNTIYNKAFFKLAPNFAPQQTIVTCGIAVAIIILNTIYIENKLPRPLSTISSFQVIDTNQIYANYVWDESNFFTDKICSVIDKDQILGKKLIGNMQAPGINLDQLYQTLKLHNLHAEKSHVDTVDNSIINQFRNIVKPIMQDVGQYLIVNYKLSLISEKFTNNGHFAIVAAYSVESDSLLLLDPWTSFIPWVWVKLELLLKSMNTLDLGKYRGYILINSKATK